MSSLNRVILIGRLTKDPDLRSTTSGKSVVEFSIAVDNRFDKDNAFFFRVKAWGNTAEFVSNYLHKGRLVSVDGRLEQRKFTGADGQQREAIEVVAEQVQGLDRPRDDKPAPAWERDTADQEGEYDPFGENQ